jgi:hypothetical protein
MIANPIVDEVHRIREEMLANYGGDLHALVKDKQRRTEQAAKAGRVVVDVAAKQEGVERGRQHRSGQVRYVT